MPIVEGLLARRAAGERAVLSFSMCHQKLAAIAFGCVLNIAATRLSHHFCALTTISNNPSVYVAS